MRRVQGAQANAQVQQRPHEETRRVQKKTIAAEESLGENSMRTERGFTSDGRGHIVRGGKVAFVWLNVPEQIQR